MCLAFWILAILVVVLELLESRPSDGKICGFRLVSGYWAGNVLDRA